MRASALFLALALPAPVTSIGAVVNPNDSVTVSWTLPADPTVVGITVFRDRLDVFEPSQEFDLGPDTAFTDFSTSVTGDYRYGVHTRNASGQLSVGVFAEVFSSSGVFVGSSSSVTCWAAAAPGPSAWPILALAALALRLRRGP